MTDQEVSKIYGDIYKESGRIDLALEELVEDKPFKDAKWMEYLVVQSRDNPDRVTAIVVTDTWFILCEMVGEIPKDYFKCHPSKVKIETWVWSVGPGEEILNYEIKCIFNLDGLEGRHIINISEEDYKRAAKFVEKINEKHKKEKGKTL